MFWEYDCCQKSEVKGDRMVFRMVQLILMSGCSQKFVSMFVVMSMRMMMKLYGLMCDSVIDCLVGSSVVRMWLLLSGGSGNRFSMLSMRFVLMLVSVICVKNGLLIFMVGSMRVSRFQMSVCMKLYVGFVSVIYKLFQCGLCRLLNDIGIGFVQLNRNVLLVRKYIVSGIVIVLSGLMWCIGLNDMCFIMQVVLLLSRCVVQLCVVLCSVIVKIMGSVQMVMVCIREVFILCYCNKCICVKMVLCVMWLRV